MKRILVIGATSAIVREYCNLRAAEAAELVLVGRNQQGLESVRDDLMARGAKVLGIRAIACADPRKVEQSAPIIWDEFVEPDSQIGGDKKAGFDEIVIGYGSLGDPKQSFRDYSQALEVITANYSSVVAWISTLLSRMEDRGQCTVVVIGSVAGDRGRSNNIVYGSAKGAIALFLQGLRQQYSGSNLRFTSVLPGLTDTPMTAHLKKGALFSSASSVALAMKRGVDKGKPIIYAPGFWWVIMNIIKLIPEKIFMRTSI
jgi:decaprenylphospho-beta-D-erythro-pentofuranosid-2-ulose 2-reductase